MIDGLLSATDQQKILAWLAYIGEDDQGMIIETIDRCKADPDTLSYFLQRADGVVKPHQLNDIIFGKDKINGS